MLTNSKIITSSHLLPTDKESIRILKDRALKISRKPPVSEENIDSLKYIKFKLGQTDTYGIPYQYASEVIHKYTLTHLQNVPDYLAGMINWRGKLLAVFDLAKLFNLNYTIDYNISYVIVVTHKSQTIGILANAIDGTDSCNLSVIDAHSNRINETLHNYISGLHNGRIAIINLEAVFLKIKNTFNK